MSTFFDTNVIVYALDPSAGLKHARADALFAQHVTERTLVVSTQVLQECFAVLTRKKQVDAAEVMAMLDIFRHERVVPADTASVLRGLALSQQYQLSVWDALIVQAALDGRCATLLSEDLQAGMRFGELEVVNPFVLSAHEPAAQYSVPVPQSEPRSASPAPAATGQRTPARGRRMLR